MSPDSRSIIIEKGSRVSNPKMKSNVVTVTPDIAKTWLRKNQKNRNLRAHLVERYANDMRNGLWRMTGEPIIFNCDGTLLDGQHRLAAVIECDREVPMLVVDGVASDAYEVIDSGASRKPQDMMRAKGYKSAVQTASLCRRMILYQMGGLAAAFSTNRSRISVAQIAEFADAHSAEIVGACDAINGLRDLLISPVPRSFFMVFYMVLASGSRAQFLDFAQAVVNGEGVMRGDPAFALRKNLLGRPAAEKVDQRALGALLAKAWNAHADGRRIDGPLGFRSGETYPELRGASQ